jgi:hypothetical protein
MQPNDVICCKLGSDNLLLPASSNNFMPPADRQ